MLIHNVVTNTYERMKCDNLFTLPHKILKRQAHHSCREPSSYCKIKLRTELLRLNSRLSQLCITQRIMISLWHRVFSCIYAYWTPKPKQQRLSFWNYNLSVTMSIFLIDNMFQNILLLDVFDVFFICSNHPFVSSLFLWFDQIVPKDVMFLS